MADDPVNHPKHYTQHPSGVECIQITEHMNFNLGNAVKYIWRAGEKGNTIEDLRKARWYIDREINRLELVAASPPVKRNQVVEPSGISGVGATIGPAVRYGGAL